MPSGASEFLDHVSRSGLLSEERLNEYVERKRIEMPEADGSTLAKAMVADDLLTPYQADLLQRGMHSGWILGDYVIVDLIGKGGMGLVFKARHRHLQRIVALKVLPPDAVASDHSVKRFQQELVALGKLHHPNIVVAHDARVAGGVHFMVMEYVPGMDLAKLVQKQGVLAYPQAVHYLLQAAAGLDFAHDHGVVHRDVKPQNLMVTPEGAVKVFDLGLARLHDGVDTSTRERLTMAGMMLGTVAYMAPEQTFDSRNVDRRSDVYSLGCTFYFLLTGNAPYGQDSQMMVVEAHRKKPPPSLARVRPDVPPELDRILAKMMAKTPDQRYASMKQLAADLRRFTAHQELPPPDFQNLKASSIEPDGFKLLQRWRDQADRSRMVAPISGPAEPGINDPNFAARSTKISGAPQAGTPKVGIPKPPAPPPRTTTPAASVTPFPLKRPGEPVSVENPTMNIPVLTNSHEVTRERGRVVTLSIIVGILTLAVVVMAGILIGERMAAKSAAVAPQKAGRFIYIVTSEAFENMTLTRVKESNPVAQVRFEPAKRFAMFPATKPGSYILVIKWPRGPDSTGSVLDEDEASTTTFVDRATWPIVGNK